MTKGITGQEPDPRIVYGDIIDLPHPRSRKHPPMSLHDRAAQFAPFAALTGYEDMISEEARTTEEQIELGEDALSRLNEALTGIAEELAQGRHPVRSITWFVPDPMKAGGTYQTAKEEIHGLDPVGRCLILSRTEGRSHAHVVLEISRILEISVG